MRCGRAAGSLPAREPLGRQVQLHYHEEVLQEARAAQRVSEQKRQLRERLRPRAKVERKVAELMRLHGSRQGRYIGRVKTGLQAVLTATMVNTRRLPRLRFSMLSCQCPDRTPETSSCPDFLGPGRGYAFA